MHSVESCYSIGTTASFILILFIYFFTVPQTSISKFLFHRIKKLPALFNPGGKGVSPSKSPILAQHLLFLTPPVSYFAKLRRIETNPEHFGLSVPVYQQLSSKTIFRQLTDLQALWKLR